MKKIILSIALSVLFLFGNVSLVSAGKVATEGNLALIADGGLVAVGVYEDLPEACFAGGILLDQLGAEIAAEALVDATDVVIDGDYAVVTIDPEDPLILTTIVTVDITSCMAITDVIVDVQECISTVNIEEGELTIPCVEINGKVVTVEMERRGNSDNWEVSFLGANPNFGSGDDDHDHDDEDDDHDDDDNG